MNDLNKPDFLKKNSDVIALKKKSWQAWQASQLKECLARCTSIRNNDSGRARQIKGNAIISFVCTISTNLNPYKANFWSEVKILGGTSNIYFFSKLMNYKYNISTIIIQQACCGINENCQPQPTVDKVLHICYYKPMGYYLQPQALIQ